MESDRISTIEDWPPPKSIRDGPVSIGFTNLHQQFIRKYAKVTTPIPDLLQNSPGKWEWTRVSGFRFQRLRQAFTEAPIHHHFDLPKPIILQMDASCFAIAGILNQYDRFGILRPVIVCSWKCSTVQWNYDTYDRELSVIVEISRQWQHSPKGATHMILIQWDHKNHKYFQTSKVLS